MKRVQVLIGDFTFLNERQDGVKEAIIHSIDAVIYCNSSDEAEKKGYSFVDVLGEGCLIPSLYNGRISIMINGEKKSIGLLANNVFNESIHDYENQEKTCDEFFLSAVLADLDSVKRIFNE